jgi:hypothetical protein
LFSEERQLALRWRNKPRPEDSMPDIAPLKEMGVTEEWLTGHGLTWDDISTEVIGIHEPSGGRIFQMRPGKYVILGKGDIWQQSAPGVALDECDRVLLSPNEHERRETAARRLRERLIHIPWYAEADRREGMDFWRTLHSSWVMTDG